MNVVMLSGWLKSGKDAVGDRLVRRHGFVRLAFADALKDEVAALHGIPRELMDTQKGKDVVRDVIIAHAQARRAQDPRYWIDAVARGIIRAAGSGVVVTDWRFPNEHDALRDAALCAGGTVRAWRVRRWQEPPLHDPTEQALDAWTRFDAHIDNTGTLDDLHLAVDRLVAGMD